MILSFFPVVFIFLLGFFASKFNHQICEFTFAERIAVWFCFGFLITILNTLLLSYMKILFLLLPISIMELFVFFLILIVKRRINISKKKFVIENSTLVLVALLILSFFLAATRTLDFVRNPDEYKNIYWAKLLMEKQSLVPGGLGRIGIDYSSEIWPWLQMYIFGLSLVFSFQIGSFSLLSAQVIVALFYSMLILATFLLGNLRSRKTGLIAAILVAFNPMVFVFSNHIMTDIPIAALATLSFYFFVKSYQAEHIQKKFLLIALLFAGMVIFTKPTGLFVFPFIPFYSLSRRSLKAGWKELIGRLLPLFIFLSTFAADGARIFVTGIPSSSWKVFTDPLRIFTWSVDEWTYFLASSPNGAYGTFIFPNLYTYGIALLMLLGVIIVVIKDRKRFNLLLLICLLYILWVFSTSAIIGGFVRHIFLIFPFLMYFAAIGLQSSHYSLALIPLFLLLLIIPQQGYVPYVQNSILPESFRLMTVLSATALILLKISSDFALKRQQPIKIVIWFVRSTKRSVLSISFLSIFTIISLFLVVGTSAYSGYYYVNQAPMEVNENITIETVGIKQAVTWVDSNIPQFSKISTNNVFEFPFYLSYLSTKNYTLINIPGTYAFSQDVAYEAFLNMTSGGETDYLIIFTVLGYMHWYPYLNNYLHNPPPRMYEMYRTDTFIVYKTCSTFDNITWQSDFAKNWTSGWSKDGRPAYQMANSGFETSDEKLHIFGVSRADDDTAQYSYWIAISTSLPSINVTKYPYLVASYVTKSQNTTRGFRLTSLQLLRVFNSL